MNPSQVGTYIHGGPAGLNGGNVTITNEADYPDGVFSGGGDLEGGTIQSSNGGAEGGAVSAGRAEWTSGTGWKGGDVRLIPGPVSGTPGAPGKILFGSFGVEASFDLNSLSTERTFSFPDISGTFGLLEVDQKWTGTNTFSKGTAATTTVNFGEMGDATSHVCFNTKNTDGQDISFYFVGTSMVVENNACQ